ncbi:hypothetical protein DICPUDRAFT_76292 [Dictyostelium purpureum]|uniref:Uncharacterized protein n=1 Tax=Dictyostelium purpureum TaxID=5786 RepID=F0ZD65_DICPU|nr:uncharacterized protein DICPUDRAFT_76292 [Dictyostelium purpureum]EGC38125.1 hypothetical protein DICPUDRAFT_76292 [Dictyostelium purpureum]|eukprot:XP_003285339.1 hypothetical protein DICPUDRAFT_76292 [Dictyostelium purpureum]
MKYLSLIFTLFIFFLNFNFILSKFALFKTSTSNPEFSIASNWNTSEIPSQNDIAFINTEQPIKKGLTVTSELANVKVDNLILGDSSVDYDSDTAFLTDRNVTANALWVDMGTSFLATLSYINSSVVFNIGRVYILSGVFESKKLISVYGAVVALEYTAAGTHFISFEEQSLLFLNHSTLVSLNDDPAFPIYGGSTILSIGSSIECQLNNQQGALENIFTLTNSKLQLLDSNLISEKIMIINGLSEITTITSNITFINFVFLSDDVLLDIRENSIIVLYQPLFLDQNAAIVTRSQSSIIIYNHVKLYNNTLMYFQDSTIIITKEENIEYFEDLVLYVQGDSQFVVLSSTIYLEKASLTTTDNSKLILNSTIAYIRNHLVLNDTSEIFFHESEVLISENVVLTNLSKLTGLQSNVTIKGFLYFTDESFFYFDSSNITIDGSFIDLTKIFKRGGVLNSNIVVNGVYINVGFFVLYDSSLVCNNEFVNMGYSNITNSLVTVNKGNFTNFGVVQTTNSKLEVNNGSIILSSHSIMKSVDSSITINEGTIIMEPFAQLNLTNTVINNKHGSLYASGDIVIETGSSLVNGGTLVLHSNILLNENSTDYKGVERVLNQGLFEIKNNITEGETVSSILLPFLNTDGGKIDISKTVKVGSLTQENGASLLLSTSNSSLEIESVLKTNLNDTISLTLDDSNNSLISIQKEFINNNSTLVIRVDVNRKEEKNTTVIKWSNISGSGFNQIQFKSYDPVTGKETDINNDCHQVYKSTNSLNVLITNGCGNKSSLSKGVIVGIVVGVAGLAAILGTLIYFKKKIYYNYVYKVKEKINIKLQSR